MSKLTIDLTDAQETALTAYLRNDVPTIDAMIMKDYVQRVEEAYQTKVVAEAKSKVPTFTDASKQVIAALEKQQEAQLLTVIATEEAKQPPKPVSAPAVQSLNVSFSKQEPEPIVAEPTPETADAGLWARFLKWMNG